MTYPRNGIVANSHWALLALLGSLTLGSCGRSMTAAVVPILTRRLVNFERWTDPGAPGKGWLARRHDATLDRLIARPWILAVLLVPLLVLGYFAYRAVPTGSKNYILCKYPRGCRINWF